MFCAITLRRPPKGAPHPEYFPIWNRNSVGGHPDSEGFTHGGYLDDPNFEHLSPRLIALVQQCLCHAPADRPDPGALIDEIDHAIKRQWPPTERAPAMRAWMEAQSVRPARPLARNMASLRNVDLKFIYER